MMSIKFWWPNTYFWEIFSNKHLYFFWAKSNCRQACITCYEQCYDTHMCECDKDSQTIEHILLLCTLHDSSSHNVRSHQAYFCTAQYTIYGERTVPVHIAPKHSSSWGCQLVTIKVVIQSTRHLDNL